MASKNVKVNLDEEMKDKTRCTSCGRILTNSSKNFYVSNSKINTYTGRISLCKDCLTRLYVGYLEDTEDIKLSIYKMCRLLDYYYTDQLYESSYNEAGGWNKDCTLVQNGLEIWKKYIKTTNSLKNYKDYSFEHGEQVNLNKETETKELVIKNKQEELITEDELEQKIRDKQNKEDIIRIIGYDPFENETAEDKSKMYAKLINMLNEDAQEDELKISAIISIIKGQNQENKINDMITLLSSDMQSLKDNIGTIKSLTDTKEKLNKSLLALAKDNKISDFYSGHKTTGSNTLTGMVKKLKEINLNEAQVNVFDIQTSMGMLQTARLSAQAIVENLNFGDDDLLDMVKFQRGKIDYYEKEYSKLKEENRKLKVLCAYNDVDYNEEIIETEYEEELKYDDSIINGEKLELEEFNKMIEGVKPISTMEYVKEVIEQKHEEEKKRIIESVKNEN